MRPAAVTQAADPQRGRYFDDASGTSEIRQPPFVFVSR
jgi:hypothetical protein